MPNRRTREEIAEDQLDTPPFILFRLSAVRYLVLFLFHAIVFSVSYALAWLLRFDFELPADIADLMGATAPFVIVTQLVVGAFFGFYRGWWRYVGIADVIRLVVGLSSALLILVVAWYAAPYLGLDPVYLRPPRGVLLVDWSFAMLTLFGARVAIRIARDRVRAELPAGPVRRVVIIGAGDAGETLAREIEHRPQLGMTVVSFVDDHQAKHGSSIRGIPVRGPIANIAKIADQTSAQEALIAIPSASGQRMREIIQHLASANLAFKTIPGFDRLVSGEVHISELRPVDLEDLIRRDKIELPGDPVRELFRGKRILVTGAGGTIGSELAVQILGYEPESLHLVERSEYALYEVGRRIGDEKAWNEKIVARHLLDVRDTAEVSSLLSEVRPHIVLHAAAHKHVPLGEENSAEYVRNNTIAARSLAESCAAHEVDRFVFISTDKATNPANVMGASKRAAEILLLDLAKRVSMTINIVRFGNVLGSSGSVVPLFMSQIAKGGPVTVTHPDATRYFLRTSEAVSLVLQAAALGHGSEVFMLDMGEPLRIVDLARNLIHLSNHSPDEIPIVYIGLRRGEKLVEELSDRIARIPTAHPRILLCGDACETARPVPELWRDLDAASSDAQLNLLLRRLVPEYTPAPQDELSKPIPDAPQRHLRMVP